MPRKTIDKIHVAFGNSIKPSDKEVQAKYDSAIKDYPQFKDKIKVEDFYDESINALMAGNGYELCKYYAFKDEQTSLIQFDPYRKNQTVKEVLQVNIAAYETFKRQYDAEEDKNGFYASYYKKMIKEIEKYFDEASEDITIELYGQQYLDFKEQWLKEHPVTPRGRKSSK